MGNSKFNSFFREIYPRINNKIIGLLLYSFESNIRWASLLSNFGLVGIGILTDYATKNGGSNIDQLGIPLLILISFILFLELIDFLFKNYVLKHVPFKKLSKNKITKFFQINWQKLLKSTLLIFLIIYSIYVFSSLSYSVFKNNSFYNFVNNFFKPYFGVFSNDASSNNQPLIKQAFQIWKHTIFSLVFLFILVIITLTFLIEKQNKKTTIIFAKLWLIILRTFPSIIVFFVFSPIFNSKVTLILVILAFHNSGSILKQLSDSVNKIDHSKFKNLKLIGWSKFKIYKHYILPYLKRDLITLFTIYAEIMFRSVVLYSSLSTDDFYLGGRLFIYLGERTTNYNKAFAYMWLIMFNIFILNIISNIILNFDKLKYNISSINRFIINKQYKNIRILKFINSIKRS
ncbi:ABC transporter permease subunit [Mycoplasma sp. 3686d]|uniref:ABC transporter permease subunit n=1 Tax=Mycoplasma sp. 3686d TaxID=2967300 RepID=UPI00211C1D49|nr:ABC transporter permease subunit [Mycoplasma sp. 3686d]UUM24790.1 ABC transporter permease subunit [Mycoplasma sp. 3686d]